MTGDELSHVLLTRPLTPSIVGDVIFNGAWLRVRAAEPSTILGRGRMLLIPTAFVVTTVTYGRAGSP